MYEKQISAEKDIIIVIIIITTSIVNMDFK